MIAIWVNQPAMRSGGTPPVPGGFLLLEDGSSHLLLEDATSAILKE